MGTGELSGKEGKCLRMKGGGDLTRTIISFIAL